MKYSVFIALVFATVSPNTFGAFEKPAYDDIDCQSQRAEVSFFKGSTHNCFSGYYIRSSEDTMGTCLSLDSAKRIKNLNLEKKYLACISTVVQLGPILKLD